MGLEELVAFYCAPVLSGIKPANIFLCKQKLRQFAAQHAAVLNRQCNSSGVFFMPVHRADKTTLLFVYNRQLLEKTIRRDESAAMLVRYGYPRESPLDVYLALLARRLGCCGDFPHEIGLFLGYPQEDVAGFICNQGQNYKLCGYWKVYGDEKSAAELFSRYTACRNLCMREVRQGVPIGRLCKKPVPA